MGGASWVFYLSTPNFFLRSYHIIIRLFQAFESDLSTSSFCVGRDSTIYPSVIIYRYKHGTVFKAFFDILPIAVDGVAPRAKMNEQRMRRFTAARQADNKAARKLEENNENSEQNLPKNNKSDTEFKFDTTSITPGTNFMQRLDAALRYYLKKRLSQDKNGLWSHLEIIYSGHQTPGEGEHKIADFIRFSRSNPNYSKILIICSRWKLFGRIYSAV